MHLQAASLIFQPEPLSYGFRFTLPAHTREVFIRVAPGLSLNGLLFEKDSNACLMIYFQGNAGNLQNFLTRQRMVLDWGVNVLVTDYRGFGKSGGALTSETEFYADAEKVYDYALQLGYPPERIILYGYSMGTAAAAHLAAVCPARALLLESGFSSIPEISWVDGQVAGFELNTLEKAAGIYIPVMILHGEFDEVISPDHAERLFEQLGAADKRLVMIKGGGHGDLKQRKTFYRYIQGFIHEH